MARRWLLPEDRPRECRLRGQRVVHRQRVPRIHGGPGAESIRVDVTVAVNEVAAEIVAVRWSAELSSTGC